MEVSTRSDPRRKTTTNWPETTGWKVTSVPGAEPDCTNERLCGFAMAIPPDDLWHPECVPMHPPPPGLGRAGVCWKTGHSWVKRASLDIRAKRNSYFASEPSRSVPAKPVSLETLFRLKATVCFLWCTLAGFILPRDARSGGTTLSEHRMRACCWRSVSL